MYFKIGYGKTLSVERSRKRGCGLTDRNPLRTRKINIVTESYCNTREIVTATHKV